jgi:hypothetical protein
MRLRRGRWRLLVGAVTLSTGGALALAVAPVADAQFSAPTISLSDVSCTGAAACEAVGSYTNTSDVVVTLAEVWNGTKWAVQFTPNPTGSTASSLSGVSCAGTAACEAVGNYTNSSGVVVTLAEVWNGTKWAVHEPPNPSGSTASSLSGVSCTGAAACEAVGYYASSGVDKTLAEVWNGTKWAVQATPNPSGSTFDLLGSVSCTGTGVCETVGDDTNSSGDDVTLAEVWNGTKWAVQATPNPSGSVITFLDGVSCTAAAACEAVGTSFGAGAHKTLAEVWNGTKWAVQFTPNPSGPTYKSIGRVSCAGAAACEAVGFYTNSSGVNVTLAEVWNGTKWAIHEPPNPSGSTLDLLSGVSCASAAACEAVGYYASSGVDKTLAEVWNGTKWAVQASPSP